MIARILKSRLFTLVLGIVLIAAGLFFASRYVRGALNAYRAMEFAQQNNFDAGNPDIELLRPWMNIRYIAEAYTVPQSFIFDEIGVEMNRPNSELPLGRLNNRFGFGDSDQGGPALVDIVREIILKYRKNPVATGLTEDRVLSWMNITYIANSTGIPTETFFEAISLPMQGHAYMPLERLIDETGYEHGLEKLIKTLETVVDIHAGGS